VRVTSTPRASIESKRTPWPCGSCRRWIVPRLGKNVSGCSALIADLDRCAVRLGGRSRDLARGDPELLFDQVDPEPHLGDRVLDLEAGVHLEEVERALLLNT
jgi:hypothetical protein